VGIGTDPGSSISPDIHPDYLKDADGPFTPRFRLLACVFSVLLVLRLNRCHSLSQSWGHGRVGCVGMPGRRCGPD
jgi:hypothetical protein